MSAPTDLSAFSALAEKAEESTPIVRERTKIAGPNPFDQLVKDTLGKTRALPKVDGATAKQAVAYLRAAAADNEYSLSLQTTPKEYDDKVKGVVIRFAVKPGRVKHGTVTCPQCGKEITVTADNKVRKHKNGDQLCSGSSAPVAPPTA